MTTWTDFVKEYALKKKVHYMVASTDAKCREAYKKSKEGKQPVKKVKEPKVTNEPKIPKESKVKESKVPKEPKKPKEVKKVKEPRSSLTDLLKGKLSDV